MSGYIQFLRRMLRKETPPEVSGVIQSSINELKQQSKKDNEK